MNKEDVKDGKWDGSIRVLRNPQRWEGEKKKKKI